MDNGVSYDLENAFLVILDASRIKATFYLFILRQ